MVTTCWRENALVKKLLTNPQQFNFFQAVLLWEKFFNEEFPIGHNHDPNQEMLRFRVTPSLSFPASAIEVMRITEHVQNDHPPNNYVWDGLKPSRTNDNQIELFINFLGLIGASGALPNHYTELLMQRLNAKDNTLLDFLDIFHHRTVSLFYRAWKKYRFYLSYQHTKNQPSIDNFNMILKCILGNSLPKTNHCHLIHDEALIFYCGLMQQPRSAINLARLLQSYFDLPLTIEPLVGSWSHLPLTDCSRIGKKNNYYHSLGQNTILGKKIWDTTQKFHIIIGEISYHEFKRLLPTGDKLRPLTELTRYYIGINLNFEIKLLLKPNEIPSLQLRYNTEYCLGWNTWLKKNVGTEHRSVRAPIGCLWTERCSVPTPI